ncbi:hypothetical protein Tco_1173293 [Tanacetum coccineum]
MSNMSEDIQYASSDTRPPMLDRTDFESWQQRIRLYCLGKDNGENIMKSITKGPFKMGTFIQTPAEETEGALQLGPERARVFTDLSAEEKERNKATVQDGRVVVQDVRGRYNANNQGRPFQRNNARGNVVTGNAGQHGEHENVLGQSDETMSPNFDDDVDDQTERFGNTCGSYLLKLINVMLSTLVNTSTEARGSKPSCNTKKNRILPAKSENKKKVEDHPRTNKSVWTKVNRVYSSISSKRVVINSNSESVCKMCNKCLNSANHKMCVVNIMSSVNATPTVKIVLNKGKQIWKPKGKLSVNSLNKSKRVWKATGKLFADIGYQWRPTGKKFTLGKLNCGYQWRPTGKKFALGELCTLTKLSVKCRPLVSGLRLFKTYDGESFKAQELCRKVHWDSQIRE